jgi:predicted nucleotidyltransferase component of viral defense system
MNSDKIKAVIREMSRELSIDTQELWQMFFLERLLERISLSEYKDNFILKGGFLIASMIGVSSRSTKDIDATIIAYDVSEIMIEKMLKNICLINAGDTIEFDVQSIKSIRAEDMYNGFRVVILAKFERIEQHIKVDISTGDRMTPREIEYKFPSIFSDNTIHVMSYNLETLLAEKLESILSKAEFTTRMRDYYDVYILYAIFQKQINISVLTKALVVTSTYRDTIEIFEVLEELMELISNSSILKEHWKRYQNKYAYAHNIDYREVVLSIKRLLELLEI